LLSFAGEVLPDATFNRRWQKDLRAGRDVMETTNTVTEIDLDWHLLIPDR
jgi:hypothetical protein